MAFKIQSYIAQDGERFSLLLDLDGGQIPCFYPTAFISRSVRSNATHETQKAYLNAIRKLLVWGSGRGIDIEQRILTKQFFAVSELDDLAHSLKTRIDTKKGDVVSPIKFNTSVSYIKKYLKWLTEELLDGADMEDIDSRKIRMIDILSMHMSTKTGSKSANIQKILSKRLSEDAEKVLLLLFSNPFKNLLRSSDEGSRFRNILMLRILYETGMRRGELLSLKLRSYEEGTAGEHPSLIIERNHHDEFDTRINQPVAKTNGRQLSISFDLETMLKRYLHEYRNELSMSGLDDEDFIFVNHRLGPRQGSPLSISSFDSALGDLKKLFPELDEVHPHLLRHHWNWRYSQLPKAEGYSDQDDLLDRCYLMGWTHNSEMGRVYNQLHLIEEANKRGLMINIDTMRKA